MIVTNLSGRRSWTLIALRVATLCALGLTIAEHVLALVALLEVFALIGAWLVVGVSVWVLLRLCWVSWAVGTADVLAVGALLVAIGKQSLALMAGTTDALSWLLHDEILATSSGWLGDLALGVGLDTDGVGGWSSSGSSGGSSSGSLLHALVLLWWRTSAVLAALVLALWADTLLAELALAVVTGAMDTEADLLLDTLSSRSNFDHVRVDVCLSQDLLLLRGGVILVSRGRGGFARGSGGWRGARRRADDGLTLVGSSRRGGSSKGLLELGDILLDALLLVVSHGRLAVLWRTHGDGVARVDVDGIHVLISNWHAVLRQRLKVGTLVEVIRSWCCCTREDRVLPQMALLSLGPKRRVVWIGNDRPIQLRVADKSRSFHF